MTEAAILALEDGSVFRGVSVGAPGRVLGEVVFNTAMTGYQEILTDPSYFRQLVTLTYPHIGNVGTNSDDLESSEIYAAGLIIRDRSMIVSNWRSEMSLEEFLVRGKTVAIAEIDTRKLTRVIREKGAQSGCIIAGEDVAPDEAVAAAGKFPGPQGQGSRQARHDQAAVSMEPGSRLARAAGRACEKAAQLSRCRARLRHKAQHPEDF